MSVAPNEIKTGSLNSSIDPPIPIQTTGKTALTYYI